MNMGTNPQEEGSRQHWVGSSGHRHVADELEQHLASLASTRNRAESPVGYLSMPGWGKQKGAKLLPAAE